MLKLLKAVSLLGLLLPSRRPWSLVTFGLAAALPLLTGCTRSVEWQEEVPLNTGETIWVQRSGSFTYRRGADNPLAPPDYGYYPDRITRIAFTYRGRQFMYTTDAWLQVLAIAPDGTPSLVTVADDWEWQWRHGYGCTRPSYVQLRPDASGAKWSWPTQIEPWLYSLPTNLLMQIPKPGTKPGRISLPEKSKRNLATYLADTSLQRIEPSFQSTLCRGRNR